MKKIYVVDYGVESDGETKKCSSKHGDAVRKILEQNGWKRTGFDSTVWKEVDGLGYDIQQIEGILRQLIEGTIEKCKVSFLIFCVDQADVYGTNKNNEVCFGTKFISPSNV